MVRAVASVFGVSFLAVGVLGFVLNPTGLSCSASSP